jgi:FkbM family methyltransferase
MKQFCNFFLVIITFLFHDALYAVKIDRVILATDANPHYIQFWPLVAQAWQEIVGVQPTLILVAPADIHVDEQFGDVIRFEPLEGLPTSYQAQVIRLFAPILFPDEVCIISDIDMLPLQSRYYIDQVKNIPDDFFIIYRDQASDWYIENKLYPMCYVAGRGIVFSEIFSVTEDTIREKLIEWHALGFGWNTDETMMARMVNNWHFYPKRVCKLGNRGGQSIDRLTWHYDVFKLKRKQLIDAHLPRPYIHHKKTIDKLVLELGLQSRLSEISVINFSPAIARAHHPCGGFDVTGELEVIQKLIKTDDVVVDIGANTGMWSQQVLNLHAPRRIIAFEPIEECAKSIKTNSCLIVENQAISNVKGQLSFYKYPDENVLSSLYQRARVEKLLHILPEKIVVPVDTLNNYSKEHNLGFIHYLKIDVEGSEYDVFDGARDLLQLHQIAMIQFEYGSTYIDSKKTLKSIVQLLSEYNYVLFKILPNGLMHIPQWTSILEDYYQSNYLAIAPQYAYGWSSVGFRK